MSASTGKPADAVQLIASGLAQLLATGTTFWLPLYLRFLAQAYAQLGKSDDCQLNRSTQHRH